MARVPIEGHPGFWRRGKTVCFKYRDRRGRQRWSSAPNLRAAKAKKAAVETDVARGEWRPSSRIGFREYSLSCIETYQGRTSKPIEESTRKDYRRRLKEEAIPFFGDTPIAEIEPRDIKEYVAHVAARRRRGKRHAKNKSTVSDNTVRLALAPVKIVLATAFEEGLLRVNPAAGVRSVAPRARVDVDEDEDDDVKALRRGELDALMAVIPEQWRLFFAVLLHLGLRIGEIIELRWRDVGAAGPDTVKIRRKFYEGTVGPPKSKYGRRTLKLTPELAAALWELRKQTRGRDNDLVFTAAEGGRIIPSNLGARVLKKAAKKAGVPWVGFHTFRHTCATLLFVEAKWNPKQVQLWLGHHSPAFTVARYIHLMPDDLPDAPELVAIAPLRQLRIEGGTSGGTQTTRNRPRRDVAAAG